ncbi:hypothetical protein C8Q74DRAFT_131289 [Fomes fomentarius]|nr:hypothetical protein C8Q74DRAFT_131289 [Fomes fomentarius]
MLQGNRCRSEGDGSHFIPRRSVHLSVVSSIYSINLLQTCSTLRSPSKPPMCHQSSSPFTRERSCGYYPSNRRPPQFARLKIAL